MESPGGPPPPIAVVGIGLRLPGKITTTDEFWELLVSRKSTRSQVPQTRYNISAFHSASDKPGTVNNPYGHYLDCELDRMDASFFSMSKPEVDRLDPQQRLLLEVVWECMESGGQRDWRGGNIGCYVGVYGDDWLDLSAKDPQHLGLFRITSSNEFALANRVSYEFDLKGPRFVFQPLRLHEACQAIYSGSCGSAVVAGTSVLMSPTLAVILSEQGVLSPTGSCKSFDARADGYARGEAVNAVYIKKLSDAMRDGDPIRGVIRATGVNFDGKTRGITNPSCESQEALIRKTYQVAGISFPGDTGFVECHGTGTTVGDPLEVTAIGRVFGNEGVFIGSVKPNVGHSEGASGITSMIKAILALEHETIPPNINFAVPNPKIPWEEFKLKVPTDSQPWPANRAHHLSYTLGARREKLDHRAFAIADGSWPLQFSPVVKASGAPAVKFVFTGQGAQWVGMGSHLLSDLPCFQADIRMMDRVLRKLPHAPPWTIEEVLLDPEEQGKIQRAEFSQPICTAVQIGLVNLLSSWNVKASAVVGHSSGEIAAAYTAGSLTLEAAIIIAYYRGQVAEQHGRAGGMAAVALSRAVVASYLQEGVVLACENSPGNVTLSGDSEQLDIVIQNIKADRPDCFVRRLKVEKAYHSHHMREIGAIYQSLLQSYVTDTKPSIPFYSTVTGKRVIKGGNLGPSYWRSNLESPVLFSSAVRLMLQQAQEDSLLLEVGPHSALSGPLRDVSQSVAPRYRAPYVPTLIRKENETKALLKALGRLFQEGVPVDIAMTTAGRNVLTNLPSYSWRHDVSYWNESRVSRDWRFRRFPPHELLGIRILETDDLEPAWRNVLRLDDVPWICDHKVRGDVVLPAAAYVAMVGEAIRQVSGRDTTGFTLRQVDISAALVLQSSEAAEVVTHLRPVRLTTSLDSDWYEFSIVSYNGTSWVKHCSGQARAGKSGLSSVFPVNQAAEKHPRLVSSPTWYQAMDKVGLNYGPNFQGLVGISALPGKNTASATITDRNRSTESNYQLHPTTIDLGLQIMITAAAEGVPRRLSKLSVPTYIDELYIRQDALEMHVEGVATSRGVGDIQGSTTMLADGKVALSMKDVKFSALGDDVDGYTDGRLRAAQLHWKPDINYAEPADLIRPRAALRDAMLKLERLSLISILETLNQIEAVEVSNHLTKFRDWLKSQRQKALEGRYDHVADAAYLARLGREALLVEFETVRREIDRGEGAGVGIVISRAAMSARAIFDGEIEPIEVLIQDGGLEDVYKFFQAMCDSTTFFELLGHANPTMKILEIGAGTGGTTAEVLQGLTGSAGRRMYSRYDYTDVSSGFFGTAQERFNGCQNIEFKTLDVSKDALMQGFEPESYDLVVASNVLHATPSIQNTLRNVRKLIKPGGRLFLQELSPAWKAFNFIMGFLPGWWLGAADGRIEEPYISPSRWDTELRDAGFSGTDAVILDDEIPYQINANIISSSPVILSETEKVTILSNAHSDWSKALHDALLARGYDVSFASMDDPPKLDADVISLLDLEEPFFHNITAERLSKFQAYLRKLPPTSGLFWITGHAQVGCTDPRYAATIGVARSVRSELSIDFATLEIDHLDNLSTQRVLGVFQKYRRRFEDSELDPDWEFSIRNGTVLIPRYHWSDVNPQLGDVMEDGPCKLEISRPGRLETLKWVEQEMRSLDKHDVEIEPHAVGLNFKDVMIAMGLIEGLESTLGLECAGVISRVGQEVHDFRMGDRVMMFSHGCLASKVVAPASQLIKIPDGLSFEDAGTMPCVFATAIHSLINVGNLTEGQTVLIHSACGGVGIAAIQIYLMSATSGRGVDLVLNSLSGELLHLSWKCVAEYGKMLEIGKRDFIGHGVLSMDLFEANRTFCGIDMSRIAEERPAVYKKIMGQFVDYYDGGHIKPITPIKSFTASQVTDAFRYMQSGQHIGKVTVRMDEKLSEIGVVPAAPGPRFRPDASYLLVGGLGGLGRAISSWMVENGARHLIYLSRSGGTSARDQAFIQELQSQGCSVQNVTGSATSREAVDEAVHGAIKPVAGVFHMTAVLKDRGIMDFSHEDWHVAVGPKVDGARNLHHALSSAKLDFFILFSSISYVVGQVGQANYAAANSFLAAFAQYRHALGLPAAVLDIGYVEDVGYLSEHRALLEQLKSLNYDTLKEVDLLGALTFAMSHQTSSPPTSKLYVNPAELVIGLKSTMALSDPNNRAFWKRDVRMAMAHLQESTSAQQTSDSEDLTQFLKGVAANPSVLDVEQNKEFLVLWIGAYICSLVFKPNTELDLTTSLTDLGVDSLVAIEIRDWWRRTLGLNINVLEVVNAGSLANLGDKAAQGLRVLHTKVNGVHHDE
ncbi:hypothetical protein DL765_009144 [Monosporascus sp. GIB2]|nr:hypothetical protein DL765_009144 [Monosporascus sp. GIB2]